MKFHQLLILSSLLSKAVLPATVQRQMLIKHRDHFHVGRQSMEAHKHHEDHEHGPHLEVPHEHGPGTGHIHNPRKHLQITHQHGEEDTHTHVNIHLEADYIRNKCEVEGSICIPLTHCPPMCQLVHQLIDPKIRNTVTELTCGFGHVQDPLVCCPIDEFSEFSACNVTTDLDFPRREVDLVKILARLYPNETEPLPCGQVKVVDKIHGGSNAAPGDWPWMAMIMYRHKPTGLLHSGCGGTLISRHYILTAGHCVKPEESEIVAVRLGEINQNYDHDCLYPDQVCVCEEGCLHISESECFLAGNCAPKHEDYEILHTFTHPEFARINGTFINDIALIMINRGVEVSDFISPICLPDLQDPNLTFGTVTGWGTVDIDLGPPKESEILQQIGAELVERSECEHIWRRELVHPDSQICVRVPNGTGSACRGDSGGPLVHQVGPIFVQVAIVSSGSQFCGDKRPTFYCPLSEKFLKWIKETVKEKLAVRPVSK